MRKHTYTNETAPTNTGSVSRPARFNLRQTCSTHARTHAVFQEIRRRCGMPPNAPYADVWEQKILPEIEHAIWHLKESPKAVQAFVASLFDPLPKEDYVRNRYARLKQRFEVNGGAKSASAQREKKDGKAR